MKGIRRDKGKRGLVLIRGQSPVARPRLHVGARIKGIGKQRLHAGVAGVLSCVLALTLALPAAAAVAVSGCAQSMPVLARAHLAYGAESTVNVPVPWLAGKNLTDAKNALNAAGLAFAVEGSDSPSAIVQRTSPDYNTVVPAGTTVTLYTKGPDVPTVVKMHVGYIDPATEQPIQYPSEQAGERPVIDTKGGSVELLASVQWSDGTADYAANAGVGVMWHSDNPDIAEVDTQGRVVARADGVATIRCAPTGYYDEAAAPPEGLIQVQVIGQSGAYVQEVAVVNADGAAYGSQGIVFNNVDGTTAEQLYAKVLYSDGTVLDTSKGDAVPNLRWSVDDTSILFVNEDTGNLKPASPPVNGSSRVWATVSGGATGDVRGYVEVTVNATVIKDGYHPADSLTLHVSYAEGMTDEVKTVTFSPAQLEALGTIEVACTQVTRKGTWQTLAARGVPVTDLLASIGVAAKEVSYMRFATMDGINGAQISAEYLFNRPHYYYPNFDAGNAWEFGKQLATPVIATESKSFANTVEYDFNNMGIGQRFRLCVGSTNNTDTAAAKSYMYISDIYVVMAGAPPHSADPDDNPDPTPGTDEPDPPQPDDPEPQKPESPDGGDGDNSSPDDGTNDKNAGTTEDDSNDNVDSTGVGGNAKFNNDKGEESEKDKEVVMGRNAQDALAEKADVGAASKDATDTASASQHVIPEPVADEETPLDSPQRWQVFEMLADPESDLPVEDLFNPLEPFVAPATLALLAGGGFCAQFRFRRELAA